MQGGNFDGLLFYQYDDQSITGDAGQYLTNNSGNVPDGGVVDFIKSNSTLAGQDTFTDMTQHRASFTGNWALSDYKLTSQTTYTDFAQSKVIDVDGLPYSAATADVVYNPETLQQFTQELRLASPDTQAIPFIAGVYFHQASYDTNYVDRDGGLIAAAPIRSLFPNVPDVFKQDGWSVAAFASASYDLTNRLRVDGGARVTYEEKEVDHSFAGNPSVNLSRDGTVVDGNVALLFDATDEVTTYVSYGHGTKSGGFSDAAAPAVSEVKDEVAESYEAGFKSLFNGGRLQFDFNIFYTEVTDFQFTQFNGAGFVTSNIDVASQGAEATARVFLTDDFQVYGNAVYSDARDDATDEVLERAPLWDAMFGAKYEHLYSGGAIRVDLNASHTSTLYNDPPKSGNPVIVAAVGDPITKLNASIGWTSPDERYELVLSGRNLTDEFNIAFASPDTCSLTCLPPEAYGPITQGRTVTLQGTLKY